MSCQSCRGRLAEVTFEEALDMTERFAFKKRIGGASRHELPDAYKQYHIRSYIGNRSLFLDFNLYKNRLKHGKRPPRVMNLERRGL